MNKAGKIIIVVALIAIVGAVIVLKQHKKAGEESSTVQSSKPVASSNAISNTSQDTEVAKQLPKLVDLGAGKCVPCKMMAPILDEIKEEYVGKFDVVFIDVWENPDEAKKYGINLIPTQIFYDKNGKELFRHEGFFSKEDILAKWKELGVEIGTVPVVPDFSRLKPAALDRQYLADLHHSIGVRIEERF